MPVNKIRDFIFENYYKQICFSKENSYYSMKHLLANKLIKKKKKNPDPWNAKEHYQSFIGKKHKISKNHYWSTKNFWKPRYYWYKIRFYGTSKNSHKLSKAIRQGEKVGSNDSLYNETKKVKVF